jgi:hypothetical protein
MPYNPGLGQGHGKKRHLHAHSPVNFKELKCYKKSFLRWTRVKPEGLVPDTRTRVFCQQETAEDSCSGKVASI